MGSLSPTLTHKHWKPRVKMVNRNWAHSWGKCHSHSNQTACRAAPIAYITLVTQFVAENHCYCKSTPFGIFQTLTMSYVCTAARMSCSSSWSIEWSKVIGAKCRLCLPRVQDLCYQIWQKVWYVTKPKYYKGLWYTARDCMCLLLNWDGVRCFDEVIGAEDELSHKVISQGQPTTNSTIQLFSA